jgi:hypothetical protein
MKEPMRALLLVSLAALLHAQSEASLKTFFEGKTVLVKIDLPQSPDGVDVYPNRKPQVDFKRYANHLRLSGVGLLNGETATVTLVHVMEKNIEFQLKGEAREASRFRVWYADLKQTVPSPQEIQSVLSGYLDFANVSGAAGRPLSPILARGVVQRGMRLGQVLEILGAPSRSRERTEGNQRIVTNTFVTAEDVIEVDFVKDVVVDYRVRAK